MVSAAMKLKRRLLLGRKSYDKPVKVLVAQLCLPLGDPMDCRPQGSSLHGILQVRILECIVISISRGSSHPRVRAQVYHIADRFFTI